MIGCGYVGLVTATCLASIGHTVRGVEKDQKKLKTLQDGHCPIFEPGLQELNRYRSDFFGRLREILSDRENIRIVGDRFVFQSEVLFPSASATLEESV